MPSPQGVRDFKAEVSAEVIEKAVNVSGIPRAFFESTEAPMPSDVSLGIAPNNLLAIRTSSPALADEYARRVNGEADIQIIPTILPLNTAAFFRARQRPLFSGLQFHMENMGFVGTFGFCARDAANILYGISNSHVVANSGQASIGHRIGQPFYSAADGVGTLASFVPYSKTSPNVADMGAVRFAKSVDVRPAFHAGLGADMAGAIALAPDDLGQQFVNSGRTIGTKFGICTAIELDGVQVQFGPGIGVLTFNGAGEFTGGPSDDFSTAGHSGGGIVRVSDRMLKGHLWAGGSDASGIDRTYGLNPLRGLAALGLKFALS